MLLDFREILTNLGRHPRHVVHIGAHLAEEAEMYHDMGVASVLWIEANSDNIPKVMQAIAAYPNQTVVCALISAVSDHRVPFHVTNHASMSSSIFEFGTHPQFSPDTVVVETRELLTSTLDEVLSTVRVSKLWPDPDTLVMDIQGAELFALQGAGRTLPYLEIIYSEVNIDEVYKGVPKMHDIDTFLVQYDFARVATSMVPGQGWGDAIYVRRI
jgi:FkbM family methyltransferase